MLLFRSSRLWYCPLIRTSNTEPTPYVYIHEKRVLKYTLMSILCRNVLDYMNLPDSEEPKQSA